MIYKSFNLSQAFREKAFVILFLLFAASCNSRLVNENRMETDSDSSISNQCLSFLADRLKNTTEIKMEGFPEPLSVTSPDLESEDCSTNGSSSNTLASELGTHFCIPSSGCGDFGPNSFELYKLVLNSKSLAGLRVSVQLCCENKTGGILESERSGLSNSENTFDDFGSWIKEKMETVPSMTSTALFNMHCILSRVSRFESWEERFIQYMELTQKIESIASKGDDLVVGYRAVSEDDFQKYESCTTPETRTVNLIHGLSFNSTPFGGIFDETASTAMLYSRCAIKTFYIVVLPMCLVEGNSDVESLRYFVLKGKLTYLFNNKEHLELSRKFLKYCLEKSAIEEKVKPIASIYLETDNPYEWSEELKQKMNDLEEGYHVDSEKYRPERLWSHLDGSIDPEVYANFVEKFVFEGKRLRPNWAAYVPLMNAPREDRDWYGTFYKGENHMRLYGNLPLVPLNTVKNEEVYKVSSEVLSELRKELPEDMQMRVMVPSKTLLDQQKSFRV